MTQVITIDGPAVLVIQQGSAKLEDVELPMTAVMFRKPTIPYGYVLEPEQVAARVEAEKIMGAEHIAQVNVAKGQFDPLPEGTDTGNVPDNVKNAYWWYSENNSPPAGESGPRWGKLDKPRNSDVDNGSEARVVVKEGVFEPLPTVGL